jgi:hypothetical protein
MQQSFASFPMRLCADRWVQGASSMSRMMPIAISDRPLMIADRARCSDSQGRDEQNEGSGAEDDCLSWFEDAKSLILTSHFSVERSVAIGTTVDGMVDIIIAPTGQFVNYNQRFRVRARFQQMRRVL